ncbi:MAG: methylated-DNA--[protein]-cysteine S-methyltransferase [Fimbriimonas sp.]|nr:methylated-DNA--[protein]-cysteine S-methyltransferase [Fimbriimonas sp.]
MSKQYYFDVIDTAIGPITAAVNERGAVVEVYTSDASARFDGRPEYRRDRQLVSCVARQLREYARAERLQFELELEPQGSEFQHRVWALLITIPYGETRTYGQLAAMLGNPKGSRAVGRANATNPISIIVPCHRVIGHSGQLTGYAGGLPFKRRLLELEKGIEANYV